MALAPLPENQPRALRYHALYCTAASCGLSCYALLPTLPCSEHTWPPTLSLSTNPVCCGTAFCTASCTAAGLLIELLRPTVYPAISRKHRRDGPCPSPCQSTRALRYRAFKSLLHRCWLLIELLRTTADPAMSRASPAADGGFPCDAGDALAPAAGRAQPPCRSRAIPTSDGGIQHPPAGLLLGPLPTVEPSVSHPPVTRPPRC